MAPGNPFPVVGIGASAGGLRALTDLLDALPPRPGLALVVIQHLDPKHESRLAELLQSHTSMSVVEAAHGAKVAPDYVYVIQPNTSVAIADGVLSVTPRANERPHYPVDHFLRSLAAVQSQYSVGVILSGTGSDGTLGICEIKAAGGLTFAQDEQSAQHAGMPQSAIESGAVDLVLPPEQIAQRLATVRQHPYLTNDKDAESSEHQEEPEDFQRVIMALRNSSGVDFSQYRDTTLKRRTARRMLLRGFASPREYAQLVERDRDEAQALYRDVLINVTSFFRDPEMFEDLKREVFPEIVSGKPARTLVRVWVPGCSTGQEVYSIAMALLEFLDSEKTARSIQIFGTDLGDPSFLDKARAGRYPESIEAEVSPDRLTRFFTKEDHHYRIQKSVRDLCVFARQNVTVDPPFSRVDLVTFRNVLIYMSPPLQERLLPVFHFALNSRGFLVLGLAETVGSFDDLFELTNRTHKIYRRKDSTRAPRVTFMPENWLAGTTAARQDGVLQPPGDFPREADRLVLGRYAPPSALVNQEFEVQQFRGRTSPYFETPSGQPTTNILRLAKQGLFMELRSALTEAKATNGTVVREGLHVADGSDDIEFTLRVLPVRVPHESECCLLVLFESKDWPAWSAGTLAHDEGLPANTTRDAAWLRQELASTKQYLQSIVDAQDAAAHELRAAHEEVLSSNEELQSTNEELETTKEELQSANEELVTVNEQFQSRNRDLDALTDDLSNFISSADLPMVTVGRDLRIRRLTPAAQTAFNLLPTDVGRSIEHIKFSLEVDGIDAIIHHVIASVQPWLREVRDRDGRWWVIRVLPFRTRDDRIDGATIVAVDIDLVRKSHEFREGRDAALAIVQAVHEPLVVLDLDCRVGLANEAFYTLFGETAEQLEGKHLWETERGVWISPDVRRSLLAACAGKKPITDLEIERPIQGRGRTLLLNTKAIERPDRPTLVLLAIADVTDARRAEALRIDAETLRLVDKRKDEFLGILAHELRNPLAPMRFALEIMRRNDGDTGTITRARQVLDRQVNHMVRIVDDLLDVSRITQGKVEIRKERLELDRLVRASVELCRPAITAAQHSLAVSLPDETVTLEADSIRLTQILVNLLNNAIKFTPAGGSIWVIAETIAEPGQAPNQLRIRVRDTGVGISSDMLPKIFDMFMQGNVSLERTQSGLGVGLTLVKNLVALHGGAVDVHSDGEGAGSEFTVTLPIDPHAQPGNAAAFVRPNTPIVRPLRILVADDNDDGREMLVYLLTADGHTVTHATNGRAAVETAAEFHPDVAILDIGMPGMNGYDVAQMLRKPPDASPVVLVALSGLGQQEDKARAAAAGFDRHFTKPVDVNLLRAFLAATGETLGNSSVG
jgi:two-component system, chemotaxis family, CheB/CheR fusion protein